MPKLHHSNIGNQPDHCSSRGLLEAFCESMRSQLAIASLPEAQTVNNFRGLEGRHSGTADTRSTQSPISPSKKAELGSETHEGEEQTPTETQIMNVPNKPSRGQKKEC
jgi:hypothetical protein